MRNQNQHYEYEQLLNDHYCSFCRRATTSSTSRAAVGPRSVEVTISWWRWQEENTRRLSITRCVSSNSSSSSKPNDLLLFSAQV